MKEKAIGMYVIPQVGDKSAKYVLVEIAYNPETGEVGKVVELSRDIREDTIDRFKVRVDELKFFSGN